MKSLPRWTSIKSDANSIEMEMNSIKMGRTSSE